MWRDIWDKCKRLDKNFISDVIYYVFTTSIVMMTIWVVVTAPVQFNFKELANNDVWFGDNWYYVGEDGQTLTKEPVYANQEHYLRLKVQDNQVTLEKTLDFTPSAEDYLCFRVSAQNVTVYVNGEVLYEKIYENTYNTHSFSMYRMYQFPAGGLQEGDKITLTFETLSTQYFIVQFPAIGDRYALTAYIIEKSLGSILVCLFIVVLIVFVLVVRHTPMVVDSTVGRNNIRWLVSFLVVAGIYIAMDSGCMEIFIPQISVINWLTGISMLMLPIPLILYTQYAFFPGHRRYEVLAFINFVITVASVLAFALLEYNVANSYKYVHTIIGVAIICCIVSFFQEKMVPNTEVIISYVAVCVTAVGSVIVYWKGLLYPPSAMFGYGIVIFGVCMFVWILRSSYEYKKMREEVDRVLMQRDKQAAEDASEQKSRFLSHMSHEIRTPLNAVLGMNELIMRESDDETIKGYAANIQNAGRTLLALINDVLDFSKIETGKMDIVETDYSLSSALNDVVLMIQGRAADKGLELKLDIDPQMPDILHGDEIRIKQVILNLMTNAVKYTEKGWLELTAKITPASEFLDEADNVYLNVMVSDSGVGIKEEEIPKLFAEFERLDRQKNKSVEGTGLGLSISSKLVALMGGTISVDSKYGEGSVFKVVIPQRVVLWEPIGDYKTRFERLSNEKEKKDTEISTFPGKRVFVVDDNEMNLEVIASILEMLEINVSRAGSGQSAVNHLNREKYDLILSDDMMPDMNGTELMQYLKSHEGGANYGTPVVVLTANAVVGAREDYIKRGFDDYMTKPIDIDILHKILMRYLK